MKGLLFMKTKRNKIFSLLLAAIMIITVFSGMTFAAGTSPDVAGAKQAITDGMLDWQKMIDISQYNITVSDFDAEIWPEVVTRNPHLFYVGDVSYLYNQQTKVITSLNVTYSSAYNMDSVAEFDAAVNKAYNEVVRTEMSDVQKALALHDYLVQHMAYDTAGVNAGTEKRNAYEALVNGIGVCEGYVLAYAALLEKAGIENDYCESTALNHIWNYVKLNNNWYHVDVTWDDTSTDREALVSHKYFLASTDKFAADENHTAWDSNVSCTDKTYDDMYWQSGDISAVYPVNNKEYFVRALKNDQNLYLAGIDLVERTGASERVVKHYDTVWKFNSTLWMQNPLISLSYYGGNLYFHTADKVYAFNPQTDSEPAEVYTYDGNDGVIGASFVCDNEIRLVIDKPGAQTAKVTVPLEVSVDKAEQKLSYAQTEVERYMGDIPFINALSHTTGDGAVTYESSNPSVAVVDNNGKVTVVGTGSAVITAKAAETNGYLAASASYKLTVMANPASVQPDEPLSGRVIVPKDITPQQAIALETAVNGEFKTQFADKSMIMVDVQLIDTSTGAQIHNEEVTFTISYPNGINSSNYTKYDFTVLHQKADGTQELVDVQPTPNGLKITSALSPFAIGYSLKQETTDPGATEPDTSGDEDNGSSDNPGGSDSEDNGNSDNSDSSGNGAASGSENNNTNEEPVTKPAGTTDSSVEPGTPSGSVSDSANQQTGTDKAQEEAASSPQTGDGNAPMGWLIMVILAAAGVFCIAANKRKQY